MVPDPWLLCFKYVAFIVLEVVARLEIRDPIKQSTIPCAARLASQSWPDN